MLCIKLHPLTSKMHPPKIKNAPPSEPKLHPPYMVSIKIRVICQISYRC